jgi:hypothetical protein
MNGLERIGNPLVTPESIQVVGAIFRTACLAFPVCEGVFEVEINLFVGLK